jgi:N-acetylglutamate synthase-like GNAT family acetyltransferase
VLDKLFVDAPLIGTGRGKRLWLHMAETARECGGTTLFFYADPNASAFYRAMGADLLEEIPTEWPGWSLHRFRFDLA